MASNSGWDKTTPSDSSSAALGDDEFRSFKSFMQAWWDEEHFGTSGSASSAGVHALGSARPFVGAASSVSTKGDEGRLMWVSDAEQFAVLRPGSIRTVPSLGTANSWSAAQTFAAGATITGAAIFGSTISVTGAATLSSTLAVTGAVTLSSTAQATKFTATGVAARWFVAQGSDPRFDLDGSRDWAMQSVDSDGRFRIYDQTGATERFSISTAGVVTVPGTLAVTGAITASGGITVAGDLAGAAGVLRFSSNLLVLHAGSSGLLVKNAGNSETWLNFSSAGAAAFSGALSTTSTLSVTGASTLTGNVGVGTSSNAAQALRVANSSLTGASQFGIVSVSTMTSAATTAGYGVWSRVISEAAAFTMPEAAAFYASNPQKGAGSTITTAYGLYVESMTAGGTNYAVYTDGSTQSRFGGTVNVAGELDFEGSNFIRRDGANHIRLLLNRTHFYQELTTDDSVLIGDTANANMTVGLTINQGANDDEAFALKSSDVAHGMTSIAETDNYLAILKRDAASGGALFYGFSEGTTAFEADGFATTTDTTKSSAGVAAVHLRAAKKSGTSVANMGSNENLVAIRNNATTVWIADAEGDTWQSGGITATTGTFSGAVGWGGGSAIASSDDVIQDGDAATLASLNLGGATVTDILSSTTVWDPGNISAGNVTSTTMTVTGAAAGDWVRVSNPFLTDSTFMDIDAFVSAADTVTLVLRNHSTGAVNPASRTIRAVVLKF